MYINKGKRNILIFPKFDNINLIQEVRLKYDKLSSLVEPHITLAFPFTDSMSDDELINILSVVLKNVKPFNVTFKGISLFEDNYILLNCIKGEKEIIDLHDKIYLEIIPTHFKKDLTYIPHITLGQCDNLEAFKDFNYEFKTLVNEVSIELIGENEESILIKNIKLHYF